MIYYANTLVNILTTAAWWMGGGYVVYASGNYFFPEQTKSVICLVGWNSIRGYTKLQNMNKKYVLPFYNRNILTLYNNFIGTVPEKNTIILVKNGKEIKQFRNLKELQDASKVPNYDFILHTYYGEDNENENYTVRHNEIPEGAYYQKSTCSFLAIELKYEGKTYQIDLKTPFNFIVKDNELLDFPFLKWYIRKCYNVDISQNYVVEFVDSFIASETITSDYNIKLTIDNWIKENNNTSDSEDYEEAKNSSYSLITNIQNYLFTTDDNNKEK